MAQDVRPYKSKEQDGQGNEIILRDQQLVEQTSQTTMASGEYFEIVDVDGRMAKIPKDNMIGVVREALGTLLNSLTDQTIVTKVPSLNGNTLGASTVATLASVLGVGKYNVTTISSTTDLDTVTTSGLYLVSGSASTHVPTTSGLMLVVAKSSSVWQLWGSTMANTYGYIYSRIKTSSGWQGWRVISGEAH